MRIIALDIGDSWTGVALSDPSGTLARPLTTLASEHLIEHLTAIIAQEKVEKIIIGYPQTMGGKESEQTKKVNGVAALIETTFAPLPCIMIDERLTSKHAGALGKKGKKTKEDKQKEHAIAAALILKSYLDHLYFLNDSGLGD